MGLYTPTFFAQYGPVLPKQVGAYGPVLSHLIYNPEFVKQKLLAHLCIVTPNLGSMDSTAPLLI